MLKHVHQICHVILHFFWWDPSAANKSPHLRLFNTHYFMPGAKSLISLIHFLFSTHYFFNYQGAVKLCFHPAAATIYNYMFSSYLNLVIGVVRGD